jgi:hypothetical protein
MRRKKHKLLTCLSFLLLVSSFLLVSFYFQPVFALDCQDSCLPVDCQIGAYDICQTYCTERRNVDCNFEEITLKSGQCSACWVCYSVFQLYCEDGYNWEWHCYEDTMTQCFPW